MEDIKRKFDVGDKFSSAQGTWKIKEISYEVELIDHENMKGFQRMHKIGDTLIHSEEVLFNLLRVGSLTFKENKGEQNVGTN